ncbi:TetR family transcriptional regulator [Neoroseomonas lacus]|uniref:TetR family transcriptional regulator n=2 Tax=Neoroseomonas lacus TaxID=287609 RepID=A0A917L256_9PROT|nr:TetR family transcriptional regulator [Neoroseomonas lacus]
MAKQTKSLISMRKTPVQGRSQETVETILEASAQILQKDGEAALTTNRIAERAGFSIGTLYQYFPNRDAILRAMAAREQQRVLARLATEFAEFDPADPEPALRQTIRVFLGAFRGRHGVRRAIILTMMRRMPDDPFVSVGVAEPLLAALETRCAGHFPPLGEAGRFVLLRAIVGCVRAAAIERSPLLGTPAFEDALVRLVMGMLWAGKRDA